MSPSEQTGPRQQRPDRPDPLAMSAAEKVAAEWEARHDVAARGHHAAPGGVQHYLAESRVREGAGQSGATASAAVPDRRSPTTAAGGGGPVDPAARRRRRWWPVGRRR